MNEGLSQLKDDITTVIDHSRVQERRVGQTTHELGAVRARVVSIIESLERVKQFCVQSQRAAARQHCKSKDCRKMIEILNRTTDAITDIIDQA